VTGTNVSGTQATHVLAFLSIPIYSIFALLEKGLPRRACYVYLSTRDCLLCRLLFVRRKPQNQDPSRFIQRVPY
jgi:hypothetical protein